MLNHLRARSSHTALLLFLVLVSVVPLGTGCQGRSAQTVAGDQSAEMQKEEGQAAEPGSVSATIEIPRGTYITVRLLETVSSRSASSGDRFDAEVANPVVVEGIIAIPERTRVRGRVVSAKPSGRLQKPGYVRMVLDSFQTADGNWVNVDTNVISRSGGSHKKRNLTLIGGGAGVGAIIGV